jgi:hypothetical protein
MEGHDSNADEAPRRESRGVGDLFLVCAVFGMATGCSYGVSFRDCEVSCTGSGEDACPDGFECVANVCRVEGAAGACLAPGEMTLRQTADDKVERSLVFGCTNPDMTTSDGGWYRVFSLPAAGVDGGFSVTKVSLGICFAVGSVDGPTIGLKVGTYAGGAADAALDLSKVSPIKSASTEIAPTQISKVVDIPIQASIPAGSNLIVEIDLPDFEGTGQQVNMGFTASGEQKPGYVRSPLCGPATPMTTSGAGLPNAHFVLTVTGSPQ